MIAAPAGFSAGIRSDARGEPPEVVLDRVSRYYVGRDRQRYDVLSCFSLEVPSGSFTAIVGPSGCGKSTLLGAVSGLNPADAGRVLVGGRPVAGVRVGTGYLFQQDALLPWKTLAANVGLPLTLAGVAKTEVEARVQHWLERVGLPGKGRLYPSQLSGGMRKRAQLAQVLIGDPQLILMDEPFSSLDVQTRNEMESDLLRLFEGERRRTVLFVTHDLEEAIALADRVVVMTAGPGASVRSIHDVSLPRPRDVENARANPMFPELYAAVWERLREEVYRHRGNHLH